MSAYAAGWRSPGADSADDHHCHACGFAASITKDQGDAALPAETTTDISAEHRHVVA